MKPEINFEDFSKIDIRIGTIIEVSDFPKANKPAYQLTIDFGALGIKKSSAQITDLYTKKELLNKQILAIVNFKKKQIAFMDYFHPNGNQFTFPLDISYTNSFGLLNYYKIFSNDKYAEMHLQHNFRGALLSKIPLMNRLNFHLVAGGKTLFTAERKPYSEYSLGLNNIGWGKYRFLRIDYVRSYQSGFINDGVLFGISL